MNTSSELILFENEDCTSSNPSFSSCDKFQTGNVWQVVSREEYDQLCAENSKEVENMTYEEYCQLENEAWHDMLEKMLLPPWDELHMEFCRKRQNEVMNK